MKDKNVNLYILKKKTSHEYNWARLSFLFGYISDHVAISVLNVSFLSLEATIADHCSSIFIADFFTKT